MNTRENRGQYTLRRKYLRNNMPPAEIILWSELKHRQLCGFKFRRQESFGPYVADFYCPRVKLVIELDGDSHLGARAEAYDRGRQKYIESFDITVIRFTNTEVYSNLSGVLDSITEYLYEDQIPN